MGSHYHDDGHDQRKDEIVDNYAPVWTPERIQQYYLDARAKAAEDQTKEDEAGFVGIEGLIVGAIVFTVLAVHATIGGAIRRFF